MTVAPELRINGRIYRLAMFAKSEGEAKREAKEFRAVGFYAVARKLPAVFIGNAKRPVVMKKTKREAEKEYKYYRQELQLPAKIRPAWGVFTGPRMKRKKK